MSAEREVAGSIPGAGPILKVLTRVLSLPCEGLELRVARMTP